VKTIHGLLLVGCSAVALAGCGPSDISGPGTGGDVIINNPAPTPTPTPTPTGPATVTPAAGCPTIGDPQGLTDGGTISGPTGTWRVCTLPNRINASVRLTKVPGLLYQLPGRVDVGCDGGFSAPSAAAPYASSTSGCGTLTADTNVTLTIDPGVIVFGGTGVSWLAVNRGNKINAVGTASQPIVFTSRDNVLGLNTDSSQGQWGGVVLMGRGKVTDCAVGSVAAGTCERRTEGAADPALFGGNDDTYNAGTMKYVQIRYSGYVLGANSELQALTPEAIGSGTTLEYIQSVNSSDDGIEFFGGVANMKYYVAVNADDDSLDVDTGARVNLQYALIVQRPGGGDALLEIDSNGFEADTPRTQLNLVNFTAIQSQVSSNNEANDQASILLRGNSDNRWVNGIIATPNNECLRMNGSGDAPVTLQARSVVMQCNATKYLGTGAFNASQVQGFFGAGANGNSDSFTPTLSGLFINGSNESGVAAVDPKTLASYFDSTTWIGAVRDANDTWYRGWTCDTATANFGSGQACTSLPVN